VNRPHRLLASLIVLSLSALIAGGAAAQPAQTSGTTEQRSSGLDVIILLDKSLSMAPYFGQVKAYVAGQVLEPILIPGDRLILEAFYGRVQRLYTGTIATEADKAAAIRTLRAVKADGHFTDIGAALDAAQRDLGELGQPDRPKYVLLITDERQEAPAGSPYVSPDYTLKHPALQYVKRVDLGKFRAITVGFGVDAKVNAAAPEVMKLLTEAPLPGGGAVSGSAGGSAATGTGAGTTGSAAVSGGGAAGSPAGASSGGASPHGSAGGLGTKVSSIPPYLAWAGLGLLILILAGAAILLLRSRKKKDKE